jgi:cytochrome c553
MQDIVALLASGKSSRGAALGPMAEVVYESLQHGSADDVAGDGDVYLKSLPVTDNAGARDSIRVCCPTICSRPRRRALRSTCKNCAQCHGDNGEGRAPAAPALAGNRAVTMDSAVNPIRIVLFGGFTPGTGGQSAAIMACRRFRPRLSKQQVADVLSYVRTSWGNDARPVTAVEVERNSGGPLW